MLTFFRRGFVAKLMLILLGLVLVAIVITGFGAGGMGLGELGYLRGGGVATVDGRKVTADEVTTIAQRQLTYIRQQQPDFDMARMVREGGIDQLIDQLMVVDGNVRFGETLGLVATKAMVDREIASKPTFQNAAGQFDYNLFRQLLDNQHVTEAQVRADIVRELMQRQLLWPVQRGAAMPKGIATRYAALLLETRSGTGGIIPTAAMTGGAAPTDAEVAGFYKSNIARYTIPERRVIRYATIGADQVAATAKPTDAEIEQLYKSRAAEFGGREERNLQQVVLSSEADAKAFAQKLASGTPFDQAAAATGRSSSDIAVGDLGQDAFAKLSSPQVAKAAFALAKGGSTAPIKSPLGWHIVHLVDIKQIAGKTLAAVHDQLAAEIQQRKAADALADLSGKMDDALAKGASFDEVVKANNLKIAETPPVTAAGIDPDNPAFTAPPEAKAALAAAFQMGPDDEAQLVPVVPNQAYALVALGKVVPAAAPPLAQIADKVKGDFVQRRAFERGRAVATAIVAKINAGMAPAQAFAEARLNLPPLQPLSGVRRDIASQQRVPAPLAALFSMQVGKAQMLAGPNGWAVVRLDKVIPGDPAKDPSLVQGVQGQLGQAVAGEYEDQFAKSVLAGMKAKRNEPAIADLKAKLANSGGQ